MLDAHSSSRSGARHRRPPRRALAVLLIFFLLILGGGAAAVTYYRWCEGASGERRPVTVKIPHNTAAGEVVTLLYENDVIRCDLVARFQIRNKEKADNIRAGTYELTTNMTLDQVLEVITRRPRRAETVDLTIPEGLRVTQIAEAVAEVFEDIPEGRFVEEAESGRYSLPPYLPPGTDSVEGFLFPETYRIAVKSATPKSLVTTLLEQFREEVADLPWKNAEKLGLTPYEVVTLASMIEEEARRDDERSIIAGVIYNRLEMNMALGIDATLQYVDPNPEDGLTADDLEIDSPYNTRLHKGLPPTPIASPGRASIEAALEPADVDFVYYVLCEKDGEGKHRFSVSYEEFLSNKNECLG